ncbi:MAG: hypothetical protein NUV34_07455 [Sulfuricaulis sp.]|nr:hypothetical protein [Sulfuricaulis sp.]
MPKGDRVCWVRSDVFHKIADRWDLAFRESARIEDAYCCAWFAPGAIGPPFFTPPAFALKGGTTEGINGRHRAALLSRHLSEFPLSIVSVDGASQAAFAALVVRAIEPDEIITLPDLPRRDCPPG